MPYYLDCQGEPCPKPVLSCKRVLEQENPPIIHVQVDNEAARVNVRRFLTSQGMEVQDSSQGPNSWIVQGTRISSTQETSLAQTHKQAQSLSSASQEHLKILVFLTTPTMGQGDDVLGQRLMGNFLTTLPELGAQLWRIILLNGAVRLATKENSDIEVLKQLEAAGVSILVCGTCLEFFNLLEHKVVGQVTNMLDVLTSQQVADKIISF